MIFSPNSKKINDINFKPNFHDGSEIEKVNEYKYLGLIIDSKLKWKSHVRLIEG